MSDCKIQHLLSPLFEFVFLVSRHCFTPSFHLNHTFGILWQEFSSLARWHFQFLCSSSCPLTPFGKASVSRVQIHDMSERIPVWILCRLTWIASNQNGGFLKWGYGQIIHFNRVSPQTVYCCGSQFFLKRCPVRLSPCVRIHSCLPCLASGVRLFGCLSSLVSQFIVASQSG